MGMTSGNRNTAHSQNMTCWLCGFEIEERVCKNGPCQICVEVEKVNQEIIQTMATLRRLIDKRRKLHSEQNRTHDLVHRLPVELTNYIFQLILSHDEWGETATVMPSYLASVCRGWRDIALSNPFLWSTMHIALRKSTPYPSNFVHNWILRSRTQPLTLHFQVVDSTAWNLPRSGEVLADVVSQCSNRLKSLSLVLPLATIYNFRNDFQWHRLTQLRIIFTSKFEYDQLSIFNTTASPEKIDLHSLSLRSLQISFNRLSSAKLDEMQFKDIPLLFQHAPQLTHCQLVSMYGSTSSMPSIIHHRLKTLSVHESWGGDTSGSSAVLSSLTLPCLQEFDTNVMAVLAHLPALVHRSSCPLTRLAFFHDFAAYLGDFPRFPALPGVTDLVVNDIEEKHQAPLIAKLLLGEHFPDLRHLTLRLQPFLLLWDMGIISLYLDHKQPRSDGPSEGRLDNFLVVDPGRALEFEDMWNSDVGEQLKTLSISLREDGFEFL